jgi:hypothetical protein
LTLISSKRTRRHKNLSRTKNIFTIHTEWASHKNGKVTSLESQDVKCGENTAMSKILLQTNSNKIRYEIKCIAHPSLHQNDIIKKNTEWASFEGEGGATNYLDRHKVDCGDGYVIQSFKLVTFRENMRYEYTCIKADSKYCYEHTTDFTAGGKDFSVDYLDRQVIMVSKPENMAIRSFQLISKYKSWAFLESYNVEYQYKYRTCTFKDALESSGSAIARSSIETRDYLERNQNTKRRFKK